METIDSNDDVLGFEDIEDDMAVKVGMCAIVEIYELDSLRYGHTWLSRRI